MTWRASFSISIQWRHWLPVSVHLWAYLYHQPLSIRENQNTQQQSKTTWTRLPPNLKNIPYSTYLWCCGAPWIGLIRTELVGFKVVFFTESGHTVYELLPKSFALPLRNPIYYQECVNGRWSTIKSKFNDQFPQQKQYSFNPESDFTNNILTRYKYVLFSVAINFSIFWK